MGYSIVDFAKSLDVDRCKIRNTPNLIFLCGGKIADAGSFKSARDYFYRHLRKNAAKIAPRVKLAEEVSAWFRQSEFPDLLELENYIADLADITVLFVESPGSIAELGAFAASDVLRPKTLAVLNNFYGPHPSFISEGPVRKLTNENEELVHYYDWNPRHLNMPVTKKEFRDMAKGITSFLVSRDDSHTKEQRFDKSKHGHALLMVADLTRIAGVATTMNIATCLKEIGCELGDAQLSRYLSLLESMAFIKKTHRSNQAFYISTVTKAFISYAYRPNAPMKDDKRIKLAIRGDLGAVEKAILSKSLPKVLKKVPRPGISMDSSLGTFEIENVL